MVTQSKSKELADKQKAKGKRTWKVMGTVTGLAAGMAATKALNATWRTATGREPPHKPDSPEIAAREALVWAAISGMALQVTKTYVARRLAHYWIRSTGELPPGMAEEATVSERRRLFKQARAS